MAWKDWKPEMPVVVCGIHHGEIREDGRGYQVFGSLAEAQAMFPDLDPEVNGKRFTWAMKGNIDGQLCIRFETWAAYELYSR